MSCRRASPRAWRRRPSAPAADGLGRLACERLATRALLVGGRQFLLLGCRRCAPRQAPAEAAGARYRERDSISDMAEGATGDRVERRSRFPGFREIVDRRGQLVSELVQA